MFLTSSASKLSAKLPLSKLKKLSSTAVTATSSRLLPDLVQHHVDQVRLCITRIQMIGPDAMTVMALMTNDLGLAAVRQ